MIQFGQHFLYIQTLTRLCYAMLCYSMKKDCAHIQFQYLYYYIPSATLFIQQTTCKPQNKLLLFRINFFIVFTTATANLAPGSNFASMLKIGGALYWSNQPAYGWMDRLLSSNAFCCLLVVVVVVKWSLVTLSALRVPQIDQFDLWPSISSLSSSQVD